MVGYSRSSGQKKQRRLLIQHIFTLDPKQLKPSSHILRRGARAVKSAELNKTLLQGDRKVHAIYSFAHLTESGYNAAVTDFVTWAIPKAQRFSEKISTLVDQRPFTDIMKIVQRPIEAQKDKV